jgi:hypothetical protein
MFKETLDQQRALKELAYAKISRAEIRYAWSYILEHKWYMSERLGRDVGLKVAAVDFFENVQPRQTPLRRSERNALPPRLPFMRPLY